MHSNSIATKEKYNLYVDKCEKHFEILFDNEIKQRFYERVNEVLSQQGVYVIICCSVQKEACIAKHGVEADIHGTALKYVIQRSIFCVDDNNPDGGKIDVIVAFALEVFLYGETTLSLMQSYEFFLTLQNKNAIFGRKV